MCMLCVKRENVCGDSQGWLIYYGSCSERGDKLCNRLGVAVCVCVCILLTGIQQDERESKDKQDSRVYVDSIACVSVCVLVKAHDIYMRGTVHGVLAKTCTCRHIWIRGCLHVSPSTAVPPDRTLSHKPLVSMLARNWMTNGPAGQCSTV